MFAVPTTYVVVPTKLQRTTRVVRSWLQLYYDSMIPVLDLAAYSCTYLLLVVSTATSTRVYPNRGTVILVPTILYYGSILLVEYRYILPVEYR